LWLWLGLPQTKNPGQRRNHLPHPAFCSKFMPSHWSASSKSKTLSLPNHRLTLSACNGRKDRWD
jgi:hypothetical protein